MSQQRSVGVARRLVMELLSLGVTDAVLAPGSRSGPIALALAAADRQGLIRLHVRVDEREAGFLALGLSKASGRVVPVVTTSGTAVANLHPAMLEAKHAGVRLFAITADRPGRLRGTGANQTTDQRGIFPGIEFSDRVKGRRGLGTGPAHLNLELDEPLVEPIDWDFPQNAVTTWFGAAAEPVALDPGPRTVVVAGDGAPQWLTAVAVSAGWPVLAEPSSGLRTGPNALVAGRLVATTSLADRIERVISAGHPTLSRPINRLLARIDLDVVHVGDQSTFPVPAGPRVRFAETITVDPATSRDWLAQWLDADAVAVTGLDHEPRLAVARAVWEAVGPGLLYVGSSRPIRDLDLVAPPVDDDRLVLANRGLAGIDGVLSSAVGAALAEPERRAIALVGDLTFLHGSNGLLIGPDEPRPDLTIVVVNDDGGGIFHDLEQGGPEYAEDFERVFGTATGADLGALCRGYGVRHDVVDPAEVFGRLMVPQEGLRVIEVQVDRPRS